MTVRSDAQLVVLHAEHADAALQDLPFPVFVALYRDLEVAAGDPFTIIVQCWELCSVLWFSEIMKRERIVERDLLGKYGIIQLAPIDKCIADIERSVDKLRDAYSNTAARKAVSKFAAGIEYEKEALRESLQPICGSAALWQRPRRKQGPPGNPHANLICELAWWLIDAGRILQPSVVAHHIHALLQASGLLDGPHGKRGPTTEPSIRSMLSKGGRNN